MQPFLLNRLEDVSGVSGTGIVAEGVVLHNGKCVLSWLTPNSSVAIYDSLEILIAIHCHDGKSNVLLGYDSATKDWIKKREK